MNKLIRLDADNFAYLVAEGLTVDQIDIAKKTFEEGLPGKKLLVVWADEFIDLLYFAPRGPR